MKKYHVTLTKKEEQELKEITKKGKRNARMIRVAYVLLNTNENTHVRPKKDKEIANILGLTVRSIENIRKKFVLDGYEIALNGRPSSQLYEKKVDGDVEAHLIALSCSKSPNGRACWSLRLLAEKAVELKYVSSISHETVRRVLKKTNQNHGKR